MATEKSHAKFKMHENKPAVFSTHKAFLTMEKIQNKFSGNFQSIKSHNLLVYSRGFNRFLAPSQNFSQVFKFMRITLLCTVTKCLLFTQKISLHSVYRSVAPQ